MMFFLAINQTEFSQRIKNDKQRQCIMLLPLESALRQEENERVQIPILKLREQHNIRCK